MVKDYLVHATWEARDQKKAKREARDQKRQWLGGPGAGAAATGGHGGMGTRSIEPDGYLLAR